MTTLASLDIDRDQEVSKFRIRCIDKLKLRSEIETLFNSMSLGISSTGSFGSAIANDALYWLNIQDPVKFMFLKLMQVVDQLSLDSTKADNHFDSMRKESDSNARIMNDKVYNASFCAKSSIIFLYVINKRNLYLLILLFGGLFTIKPSDCLLDDNYNCSHIKIIRWPIVSVVSTQRQMTYMLLNWKRN